ncbi:hypothetical protein [Paradesulfitobacterium ferrireducens]|uniref:hypothetical protein n=1 Tax=Paradesulfitobacterium ferrireducens TaxID=2816476 RepID=UPI001A8D6B75|nr:hypothetical protein [Paradesulfitobacterium ferrireducens]
MASAIGPYIVGVIVSRYSLSLAFAMFGLVALAGAIITALFAVETKGKILEQISP